MSKKYGLRVKSPQPVLFRPKRPQYTGPEWKTLSRYGFSKALKFPDELLRRLHTCAGGYWIIVPTCDKTIGMLIMQMVERSIIFGFSHTLGIKGSNYFWTNKGQYYTPLPSSVVVWFSKALQILPGDTKVPEESAWVLAVTSNVIVLHKCSDASQNQRLFLPHAQAAARIWAHCPCSLPVVLLAHLRYTRRRTCTFSVRHEHCSPQIHHLPLVRV